MKKESLYKKSKEPNGNFRTQNYNNLNLKKNSVDGLYNNEIKRREKRISKLEDRTIYKVLGLRTLGSRI